MGVCVVWLGSTPGLRCVSAVVGLARGEDNDDGDEPAVGDRQAAGQAGHGGAPRENRAWQQSLTPALCNDERAEQRNKKRPLDCLFIGAVKLAKQATGGLSGPTSQK
jgi:hypothetical protein